MNTTQLNLARKWRSKNFDQIVGQDISIRILKNTLYLNQFFPVYLFSGQRGCGKTSTARIFAAAINCEQLPVFQKNPKQSVLPCSTCASCVAMATAQHPDFIEIDAASHTGVDNVRQIVDAASLLPILGRKKIYLIDEAHMLSKAAFNAFLKMLEEPPVAVVFILATTDAQKIIETVRSRCFQLFFKSLDQERLIEHLAHICAQENIKYERDALSLIIHEASGSVRDAINILEQVRFSSAVISSVAVRQVLGHIDDNRLLELMQLVFRGDQKAVLTFCASVALSSFDAAYIWKSLVRLARALLWSKHGVNKGQINVPGTLFATLTKECSLMQVQQFLEHLYQNEFVFSKTTSQHALLEMVLLQICSKNRSRNSSDSSPLAQAAPGAEDAIHASPDIAEEIEDLPEEEAQNENDTHSYEKGWPTFVDRLADLHDPLIKSIFSQGAPMGSEQQQLLVNFPAKLLFFKDWLSDTKNVWLPILQAALPTIVDIKPLFVQETVVADVAVPKIESESVKQMQTKQPLVRTTSAESAARHNSVNKQQFFKAPFKKAAKRGVAIDTSDKGLWPQTNLILRHFPGIITELKESKHE